MVFFSCNVCNESLKKNQVDKHLMRCRHCEFLSCIDCGKEFWGDSYQSHTKCISEEEKYSGKNYVAKANKGEVKQEQWIQKVQAAIQKAPANPQLKNLLQRLEDYPNVPRKKAKFENFLKCSLRVMNPGLVNQVWDLLMAEAQKQGTQNGSSGPSSNPGSEVKAAESNANGDADTPMDTGDSQPQDSDRKLSKRERKEQRQKKAHKAEKKDRQPAPDSTETGEGEEAAGKKKKGKRRKRDEEEEEMEEESLGEAASQPKKKKRKGDSGDAMDTQETADENGNGEHLQKEASPPPQKGKFDWNKTIIAVLKAKGEISVKRLQKKVLAEYASYGSSKPENRVEAKFHKKLSKLPNVKVLKDKARLVSSKR